MECKKCNTEKASSEFYNNDRTCKVCRRLMVKENRDKNQDHYKSYDQKRYQEDPRVKARHKIYAQTESGKEAQKKAHKKWIKNNPIKRGAHIIVGNAIRDGKLIVGTCEVCGLCKVNGHHDDYAKPLTVRWLCDKHHTEWHKEHGEGKNAV